MLKYDEAAFLQGEHKALALRGTIEAAIDEICARGFDNIIVLGLGGTYAHAIQMQDIWDAHSHIPLYVVNTGEFISKGFFKLTDRSLVIVESSSGDTKETVAAVRMIKERFRAPVYGIINRNPSTLAGMVDYLVSLEVGVHYKLYYTFIYLLHKTGSFPDYEAFCACLAQMPQAMAAVRRQFDPVAEQIAKSYSDRALYHLIGAGNLWGFTFSYGMCSLEEMLWMKTKSVHAADFFHGALEIIEKESTVLLFMGEDASRPLMERVHRFVDRVCAHVLVFDTKDYELRGIEERFRGLTAPFVMLSISERLNVHFERERRHPLEMRRYYRSMEY